MKTSTIKLALLLTLLAASCRQQQPDENQAVTDTTTLTGDSTAAKAVQHPPAPEWAKNATIYEVNVRQFSEAGNLAGVEAQLPRLKELGVDIVWLMPIYPIGKEKRKGSLGSPYSVANFTGVNPEYGTMDDLKRLVQRAHDLGLRVILDFVPNHTAWDHPWVTQHPDWYSRINGKMTSPLDEKGKPTGWEDVVDLDYAKPELRKAMTEAMTFWLREADIDGYRMDVAGLVPNDFWREVRPQLDKVKTVFMLAEWEADADHFKSCFNMNYGWAMHKLLKDVAKGKQNALAIDSLLAQRKKTYPDWAYQMQFTQNHDENTWNGTLTESFGPGAKAFVVLTSTFNGMPLVYGGLEAGLNKRLAFFEKDPITWGTYPDATFYKSLLTLKHRNRALWNGPDGGELIKIPTGRDEQVYAFFRQRDNDRVVVVLNLSGQPQTVRLGGEGYEGRYTEIFNQQPSELKTNMSLTLKPWEYRVLTN